MLRRLNTLCFLLFAVVLYILFPPPAHAQNSLSLTVTPPLFQLTIGPGEQWRSSLKIVNNNERDVAYYATVVDFEAQGESGQGKFVPIIEDIGDPERRTYSLASWIEVSDKPVTVARGSSADIPFTVRIPDHAEPGGHSAAILVGTQPPGALKESGPLVQISSYVSSLFFVRIQGDVIEDGRIREFRTDKMRYERPSANFVLRFENKGNVHLRPQGNITIYNMWGKERGSVEINRRGSFGNVLPDSIRKFEFTWDGAPSVFDIGRYSAQVALVYGEDGRKTVSAKAYFWVIPIVPVAATIGGVAFFMFVMIWFIRRYVRRALELEKSRLGSVYSPNAHHHNKEDDRHEIVKEVPTEPQEDTLTPPPAVKVLMEPLREGVIDLRSTLARKKDTQATASLPPEVCIPAYQERVLDRESEVLSMGQFFAKYKLFFLFCGALVVGAISFWWYLGDVLVSEREFSITEIVPEAENVLQIAE